MVYLIIILHFVSDWMLQPRKTATNKSNSIKYMLAHVVVIHIIFSILAYFVGVSQLLIVANTLSHMLIDKFIWAGYKRSLKKANYPQEYFERNEWANDYWFYTTIAFDQILHLSILMFIFN